MHFIIVRMHMHLNSNSIFAVILHAHYIMCEGRDSTD